MNIQDTLNQALRIIGKKEIDTLFSAPRESSTICVHFASIEDIEITSAMEIELDKLGVWVSAKYETLCIDNEVLLENREER